MFSEYEREVLASEAKRQKLARRTVYNVFQRVRNKASKAVEDLLFLAENRSDQFNQVIGRTPSGRSVLKAISRRHKRKGIKRKLFHEVRSKRDIERAERGFRAFQLYTALGLFTGAIEREVYEEKLKRRHQRGRKHADVDFRKLGAVYPVAVLKGQFLCPKCRRKGLIFHGVEEWFWFHYNHDDRDPKATFCPIGKKLPENFLLMPIAIEPQETGFWLRASDKPLKMNRVHFWT